MSYRVTVCGTPQVSIRAESLSDALERTETVLGSRGLEIDGCPGWKYSAVYLQGQAPAPGARSYPPVAIIEDLGYAPSPEPGV